ncbi:thymidine phosphorylase, partial [Glutamicibacter creatinolyticus]
LVRRGQPIATLLTDTPQKIERAAALVERSLVLGAESDRADTRLIIERITAS